VLLALASISSLFRVLAPVVSGLAIILRQLIGTGRCDDAVVTCRCSPSATPLGRFGF
jgi:hypothetical protein